MFRGRTLYSSLNGSPELFRRDFAVGEKFNRAWITGWEAGSKARKGGHPYRTYRLAEKAAWSKDPFSSEAERKAIEERKPDAQVHNRLAGLALDAEGRVYVAHEDGRLKIIDGETGREQLTTQIPTPALGRPRHRRKPPVPQHPRRCLGLPRRLRGEAIREIVEIVHFNFVFRVEGVT